MHRKITALILLLAVSLMSGCVSHIELDKIAIAEAIGIDRDENGFTVTVQYFNTDSSGGVTAIDSTAPNAVTVTGHGSSTEDALRDISFTSGKKLLPGSAELIVIGRGAASGLRDLLSFAASHYSGDPKAYIALADGKASDIMKVKFSEGNASSDKLESIIKNAGAMGIAGPVMLYEVMEDMCSPTASVVMPLLTLTYNEAKFSEDGKNITVSGAALCTADAPAETLSAEESSGMLFLTDNSADKHTCGMTVRYHGDTIYAELYEIKTKVVPAFDDDILTLEVNVSAACEYVSADIGDPFGSKKDIESLCGKEVVKRVTAALEKTLHTHGADAFGLSYKIRACSPGMWDSVSADYREYLKNSRFVVRCNVSTERFGMIH